MYWCTVLAAYSKTAPVTSCALVHGTRAASADGAHSRSVFSPKNDRTLSPLSRRITSVPPKPAPCSYEAIAPETGDGAGGGVVPSAEPPPAVVGGSLEPVPMSQTLVQTSLPKEFAPCC